MSTFEDIVQSVARESWGRELSEERLREVFDMLPEETKWEGVYWEWKPWDVEQGVIYTTHKYINKLRKLEE